MESWFAAHVLQRLEISHGHNLSLKYYVGANFVSYLGRIAVVDGYENLVDYPCIAFSLEIGRVFLVRDQGLGMQVFFAGTEIRSCCTSFWTVGQD